MSSSAARRQRRLNEKAAPKPPSTEVSTKLQQVLQLSSSIQNLAEQIPKAEDIVKKVNEVRELTALVLQEHSAFDYELTRHRLVNLRLLHEINNLPVDHATLGCYTLVEMQTQFECEYDAVQALVLLVARLGNNA